MLKGSFFHKCVPGFNSQNQKKKLQQVTSCKKSNG